MEISFKIILYAVGSVSIVGLLYALFRRIVLRFFDDKMNAIDELIHAKNDHALKITELSKDIEAIKKDLDI